MKSPGCRRETAPDDYDRACAVDDLAGVITVGENGAQALVPADEPAPTSLFQPVQAGDGSGLHPVRTLRGATSSAAWARTRAA
ncbi:Imm21 family immunity protein [Streptomyces sp. NPDC001156]